MKNLLTALVAVAVLVAPLAAAAGADITADAVRKAIRSGVKFLEGQQKPDGSWEEFKGYPAGTTALCTLALLYAGVDPDDPNDDHVARALRNLVATDPATTYVVSLETMVFTAPIRWSISPRSRPAPRGSNGTSLPMGAGLIRSARATIPTASSPCWRLRGPAGLRRRPRRRPGQRSRLATGQDLLGTRPAPRRLLGIRRHPTEETGPRQHGHAQHDLRRHQLADHRRRHGPPGRRRGRRQPNPMLRTRRRGKRPYRTCDGVAGKKPHRERERDVFALLSLQRGTRRPPHQPTLPRQPRLVSRRRRLPGPLGPPSGRRGRGLLGKARPWRTIASSPPALPCCSSPRAAAPSSWPNSATAPDRTGTSTATTWATSPPTSSPAGIGT